MKIHKVYKSDFSKEVLYEAWISKDMVIAPVVKLEIEAKVGGVYKLFAESPDGIFIMSGLFQEIEPNARLVYSWQWEGTEEETTVEVCFNDSSTGSQIDISHIGFLTKESYDNHATGWDSHFKELISLIANKQKLSK